MQPHRKPNHKPHAKHTNQTAQHAACKNHTHQSTPLLGICARCKMQLCQKIVSKIGSHPTQQRAAAEIFAAVHTEPVATFGMHHHDKFGKSTPLLGQPCAHCKYMYTFASKRPQAGSKIGSHPERATSGSWNFCSSRTEPVATFGTTTAQLGKSILGVHPNSATLAKKKDKYSRRISQQLQQPTRSQWQLFGVTTATPTRPRATSATDTKISPVKEYS